MSNYIVKNYGGATGVNKFNRDISTYWDHDTLHAIIIGQCRAFSLDNSRHPWRSNCRLGPS